MYIPSHRTDVESVKPYEQKYRNISRKYQINIYIAAFFIKKMLMMMMISVRKDIKT